MSKYQQSGEKQSFHPVEAAIVERLRAAGWIVIDWEYDDGTHHDDAHFWGTDDLIVARHSTAVRALRAAARGRPIPPPTKPEWYWIALDGAYFANETRGAMAVEIIARGGDFNIEQTISAEPPRGDGWTHCPEEHPRIWRRLREMQS